MSDTVDPEAAIPAEEPPEEYYSITSRQLADLGRPDTDPAEIVEAVKAPGQIASPEARQAASIEDRTATSQRDFLMRTVEGLLQRLAGAHVASGHLNIQGAAVFVERETLPINQTMLGIAQHVQQQGT